MALGTRGAALCDKVVHEPVEDRPGARGADGGGPRDPGELVGERKLRAVEADERRRECSGNGVGLVQHVGSEQRPAGDGEREPVRRRRDVERDAGRPAVRLSVCLGDHRARVASGGGTPAGRAAAGACAWAPRL